MEEGQRLKLKSTDKDGKVTVLILVVMEEGQRPRLSSKDDVKGLFGLNPCCNGRGSKTDIASPICSCRNCLNPCCNGRGSKTIIFCFKNYISLWS